MPQDWQAWVGAAQGNWDDKLAAFLATAHDDDGYVQRDGLAADVAASLDRVDPGEAAPTTDNRILSSLKGVIGWKKPNYITVEDFRDQSGVVDIQAALNAVPATGQDVVFKGDEGTNYLIPNTGLTVKAGTRITPSGSRPSILKAPTGATSNGLLNIGSVRKVRVEGIELDLLGHATMTRGINAEHNTTTDRDIAIRDVVVRNALGYGIYVWQSADIRIENTKVFDSEIGIYINTVKGMVRIINPQIVNTVSGRMKYGITVGAGSAQEGDGVEILSPYISGANYPSVAGAEAHGINVTRSRAVRIIGGTVTACGNPANGAGGGIVVAANAHYGAMFGTHVHHNVGVGVWSEIVPSGDTTLGADTAKRGMQLNGVISEANLVGFSASYGAGTVYTNCQALESGAEGFVTDAEDVTYVGCRSVNGWTDTSAARPSQNGGVKAGFRVYGPVANRAKYLGAYVGCTSLDNRTTQLQEYGFAAEDKGYRFVGNNGDGSISAYTGGTTSNKFSGNAW